jgi:integrase
MFELWKQLKRGLKDNTFQNYQYMYRQFVAPNFGRKRISTLLKSDVKRFYNTLADERGLSISTIDNIHTVLHQILDMAVDDCFIRRNPSDNVLKELKQTVARRGEARRALTLQEQELFLHYLRHSEKYRHWYPVFAVMIGTGLRVGETVGLRWCDIDLEQGLIDVNHTLVYYRHAVNGCYCNIHTPKTVNGIRQVPMLSFVKKAFQEEQQNQTTAGIHCEGTIDGYTDFIFINRYGQPHHQGTLNKALRRIIRDCNDEIVLKGKSNALLLPHFSCHSLRHTFTTRMCEAGVNIKVIQDALGHADVSTTLNIYADATKDLKVSEFQNFETQWEQALQRCSTGAPKVLHFSD